jgi:hypothetical protein
MNLAGETNVVREFSFHREPVALDFAHLARIAIQDLNAASCATGVATTAMKNIDTGIFDD